MTFYKFVIQSNLMELRFIMTIIKGIVINVCKFVIMYPLVVDCQMFPCIDYMKKLIQYKHIKIEAFETYQKMSFRNRYIISTGNGLLNLSIPISGGREQKAAIKEVRIDNTTNWKTKHWRSLHSAYSKAPFFEFYEEEIRHLIFSENEFLFLFNIKILNWLRMVLKMRFVLELTEEYVTHYNNATDCRNFFVPKSFQKNIDHWLPRYPQVFEERIGFQPNLSVIDLILCQGPNAVYLINQSVSL